MIIIADAGNTKTDWVLTGGGNLQQRTRTAGISPYFDTETKIAETITEVKRTFASVVPSAIYYYGTGCNNESKQEVIRRCLRSVYPDTGTVVVSDDLTGAGIALFGSDKGIAVITGTGSNAGITSNGVIIKRIITLGYLLGDEGSGAAIGLFFLRQLLGKKLPAPVTDAFFEWRETTHEEMITELYGSRKPQTVAASLVPFLREYRHEDEIRKILTDSFSELLQAMVLPMRGDDKTLCAGFCGSIAFYFKEELSQVCADYGIIIASIVREPAIEIAAYHNNSRL